MLALGDRFVIQGIMYSPLTCCLALLLSGNILASSTADTLPRQKQSIAQLEQRLVAIDSELKQLARTSLRGGIGGIGYRSMWHETADQTEWVEIELGHEFLIDEIVLTPVLWRDSVKGFQADAFPEAFRIIAGTKNSPDGTVVADFQSHDHLLPRIAPLVIPANGITASWVRIEATRLSARNYDKRFLFQLSEVLVFSGADNVALRSPVTASSTHPGGGPETDWGKRHLTDGHMPYLMDAAQGERSRAYLSTHTEQQILQIDLQEEYEISRIHLHMPDPGSTVPQSFYGNRGLPQLLLIEGATQPDFSDATILLRSRQRNIYSIGPIMMWSIPKTNCRYVRIRDAATNPSVIIGFAEIELFSKGQNVALGKPITARPPPKRNNPNRRVNALNDGRNLYGSILPTRKWVKQLARRHDLETKRPLVATELSRLYTIQQIHLRLMQWLAMILTAGVIIIIMVDRHIRLRQAIRIKERFAADLHDELGANIHTTGLLVDLAKGATDNPNKLHNLLERATLYTDRSAKAARYCTNMLEAKNFCENIEEEMTRTTNRLLADLDSSLSFEGEEFLIELNPRKRIDLFLFYKECLTNIIRHSSATKASARLVANKKTINLTITDNGIGLTSGTPPSLKRRARLLGARIRVNTQETGGTCINLELRTRSWLLLCKSRSSNSQNIKPQTKKD